MFFDGVVAPDRGALALEGQADHPARALRVLLGHRGVDLGALQEDRAEHVLLGAVLLAGHQRQGRVVVAAQRVLRRAVQRGQRRLLHGRVGALPGLPGLRDGRGQRRVGRGRRGRRRRGGRRCGAGASPGPWAGHRAPGSGGRRGAGVAASGDCAASGANGRSTGAAGSAAPCGWAGGPRGGPAARALVGGRRLGGGRAGRGRVGARRPGAPGGGRPGRGGRDRAADDLTEPQLRGLARASGPARPPGRAR